MPARTMTQSPTDHNTQLILESIDDQAFVALNDQFKIQYASPSAGKLLRSSELKVDDTLIAALKEGWRGKFKPGLSLTELDKFIRSRGAVQPMTFTLKSAEGSR